MRPTEYLRWSARDRGLAEGLIAHEDSIGPHGIPWDAALNPDNEGWFETVERVDQAQAALDRWHAEHKGKDVEPGTRVYVVDTRVASGPGLLEQDDAVGGAGEAPDE